MSDTPALTLQDLLNDIERNAYDGVSFTEEVDAAYTLAAEMGKTINQLKAENAELRNDADLLRAMLSQERLEKQCYMAENAELQETLQRRTEQFEGMTNMWAKRGVENFKLRELVRDIWRFTGTACKKYPRLFDPTAQGAQVVLPNMIDAFEQRMRELGVEVDDG